MAERRRGRPPGDQPPMTAAQRMARMRERRAKLTEFTILDPSTLGDGDLLVALAAEFRAREPLDMLPLVEEMFARANVDQPPERTVHIAGITEDSLSARHAHGIDWVPIPRGERPSYGTAEKTAHKPERAPERPKVDVSYPLDARSLAVALKAKGWTHSDIASAIKRECGRAPLVSNLSKLLQRWARDPEVMALLPAQSETP